MFTTKLRRTVITLVAAACLGSALVAPAASQAQWHTLNIGGHIIIHGNYNPGGVSPCQRIGGELGQWGGAVGDYHEWVDRHNAGEATAKEELANAEGEVVRVEGEAFEYGCDTVAPAAARTKPQTGPGKTRATAAR
jgi:hypothetical protein